MGPCMGGAVLPMTKGAARDPVSAYGITQRIQYVRLVRRTVRVASAGSTLVCAGLPMRKRDPQTGQFQHPYGTETQGVDFGLCIRARVGATSADLQQFAADATRDHATIRRLPRQQDRQRRANNPDGYPDGSDGQAGRSKPASHPDEPAPTADRSSRSCFGGQRLRRTLHGQMANQILVHGVTIKTEKLSCKTVQKMFGRSIRVRAPKVLVTILTCKAESAGGRRMSGFVKQNGQLSTPPWKTSPVNDP